MSSGGESHDGGLVTGESRGDNDHLPGARF